MFKCVMPEKWKCVRLILKNRSQPLISHCRLHTDYYKRLQGKDHQSNISKRGKKDLGLGSNSMTVNKYINLSQFIHLLKCFKHFLHGVVARNKRSSGCEY